MIIRRTERTLMSIFHHLPLQSPQGNFVTSTARVYDAPSSKAAGGIGVGGGVSPSTPLLISPVAPRTKPGASSSTSPSSSSASASVLSLTARKEEEMEAKDKQELLSLEAENEEVNDIKENMSNLIFYTLRFYANNQKSDGEWSRSC